MDEDAHRTGERGLGQGTPPTRPAGAVTVDLNAIEPDPIRGSAAELCPGLHSPLTQIIESEHPVREAQALGLSVHQDQVQVTLVLKTQDSGFLKSAGFAVDKQAGRQVQAFVPVSRLCELATDKRILAVYPASQAETQ
jgi:hypothetical protein